MQNKSTISVRRFVQTAGLMLIMLACSALVMAQQTTGSVRGVVKDPNGAVVPGAKVTITNSQTNISSSTQTSETGEYEFNNLLVGTYKLVIESQNFKALTLSDVRVVLNKTTDVPTALTLGLQTETVEVSAGGAELVDTTTTTLNKDFTARQVQDLAQTSFGAGGINNLALIAPNVTSSGGVGVGTGGSVGGQRPRNNNFVVDGIDNNDKAVTGPQVYISPDTVSEFSLLANQYSAEFSRSTGGQFITVTKSGTNNFHGTAYGFFRNRHLNAMDSLIKTSNAGVTRADNPRSDYGRYGGNIGGPIIKDKLFFFGSYERLQQGSAAASGFASPTAAGYTILNSITGLSQTNLGVLKQFVPASPINNEGAVAVVCPNGASAVCVPDAAGGGFHANVPVGDLNLPAPNFSFNHNIAASIDYNQNEKTQHRGRFVYNRNRAIDNAATFSQFFVLTPTDTRLFSYTMIHSFSPKLTNELRLGYRRLTQFFVVPSISFPGLDQFPNISVDELGFNIGPDPNAPQFNIENNYQIVDNVGYQHGNHSLKFGGDFRKLISPQSFVQRQRGDYEYAALSDFLVDISGVFNERSVGASPYYGDQKLFFTFAQDDWRVQNNLTLNLGLNYSLQQVPFSAKQQTKNSIASVPGLIEFNEPKMQKKNFAPRVGLAYSPAFSEGWLGKIFGGKDQSSIRAGFSMAYDVIFDNLYILSLPPQFNQTVDKDPGITNFLKNGGILPTPGATGGDPVAARKATSAFIPDQKVPYSFTYTTSFERQFAKNYALELRYLGTRGVDLLTQNRLNRQNRVTSTNFIPTLFSDPTPGQLAALPTLAQVTANVPSFVPAFTANQFNSNIVAFLSNGNSSYNAFSAQLSKRFTSGWQGTAAYTWSHSIDDTTAEVFSTVLSPRRVQDFRNLKPERADSALDHRHRFVLSSVYDLPFFNKSSNWMARSLAGGWSLAGTLSLESGEKATVRSGVDTNLNGDNAGDRTIFNPNGTPGTSSTVHGLNSLGQTVPLTNPDGSNNGTIVAYRVDNPNAQYIKAAAGALTNTGRNTLQLPGINNLDFSIFKNFAIKEQMKLQFRVDMYNAFNHAQYTPGSVNGVEPISTTSTQVTRMLLVGDSLFNRPDLVLSNHPRVIQMQLRFTF